MHRRWCCRTRIACRAYRARDRGRWIGEIAAIAHAVSARRQTFRDAIPPQFRVARRHGIRDQRAAATSVPIRMDAETGVGPLDEPGDAVFTSSAA